MATLDRLRGIVKPPPVAGARWSTARRRARDVRRRLKPPPSEGDRPISHAALELGGAVVEHSDGAVIVVDREYRADVLHGRTPIGDIVSTINDGDEALR